MTQYQPILDAACAVIKQVMEAGEQQRKAQGRSNDEWRTQPVEKRIHHAFMHLVGTQTSIQTAGHPFSLTDNTALEDWKHALGGLAIVAAHEMGYLDFTGVVAEIPEDE
jgi:hypothetical protein